MNMAIPSVFRTSKEAKEAGWFSRRHQTSKENIEAHKIKMQKKERRLKQNP
jgi:hypothetical protein